MIVVCIDKTGGRHYHKGNCAMVQDTRFPYEKVEVSELPMNRPVVIEGKEYWPCPGCYQEKLSRRL